MKLFLQVMINLTSKAILGTLTLASLLLSCRRDLMDQLPEKPNIVLIMADDLGFECLGCNGGTSYQTPNLDKLAETGVRFTYCYSTPLCTPSRVQIMTGKYNYRNYTAFVILEPGEKTFGHYLKETGYTTGITGKWQLYGSTSQGELRETGTYPTDAGFDEYCLWQIDTVGSRFASPVIHYNSPEAEKFENQYGPDIFLSFISEFLENHKEKPFFLYYPMVLPHDPHVPTPESKEWDMNRYQKDDRFFRDMVEYMDKVIGIIVQNLEDLELRENTIVFFTGDNGTNRRIKSKMGVKEVKGGKGFPTTYGTHVPLIVNCPEAIPENKICHELIDFTDFLPTLADLAGISLPESELFDGQSFIPVLFGKTKKARDWIFCHYDCGKKQFPLARYVQNKRYKLYESGNFFDIQEDDLELSPIEPEHKTRKQKKVMQKFQEILERIN